MRSPILIFLIVAALVVASFQTDIGRQFWREVDQKLNFSTMLPTPRNEREKKIGHLDRYVPKAASMISEARPGQIVSGKGMPLVVCMEANGYDPGNILPRFGTPPCIDSITAQLPPEMIPQRSEDIALLVGLYWGSAIAEKYPVKLSDLSMQGGKNYKLALQETCRIRLVEVKTGRLIETKVITGSPPSEEEVLGQGEKTFFGPSIEPEVLAYILQSVR